MGKYLLRPTEVATLGNEFKNAGKYEFYWDAKIYQGKQLISGLYFYRLETENTNFLVRKLLIDNDMSIKIKSNHFSYESMRIFNDQFFLLLTVFVFVSSGIANAAEKRVQAELMKLTNYQVGSSENTTFIKLTGSTGVATFNFNLPSGKYDIDACYMSEKIGQNTYAVYLNDVQIISWLGKNRDNQWHFLSEQKWHAPKNIALKNGDKFRIETLSATGSLAILDYIGFKESDNTNSTTRQSLYTIYPEEYEFAFKNPLKGFRASHDEDHEYSTLSKTYIGWKELENIASDGVEKIIEVSNSKWSGYESKNIKFIPRVYLAYPRKASGWPSDMTEGDFTSDQFKQRVVALIKKLGKAWDNDSRVAFVEMGLIGEWGEMEFPNTRDDIKEAIAAQFAISFQNKLVMIRWPNTYNDDIYNFGYYWDSWGHYDQRYYGFHLNNTSPKWKTAVIGGEAAYDWGNRLIQPGKSPDITLSTPIHRDFMIDQIRSLHANHMGWIANYDQKNDSVRTGAEIIQEAMGYRFVISEVSYPKRIDSNTNFLLSFKVKNTGSTPFYYNWPVEVSLLDSKTRLPVWKQTCRNLDIRYWLPGDKWDDNSDSYTIPAETNLINQSFQLPNLPKGEYILALAILDPAGNRPAARFAIKNYYNGGRHPIGKVGVNQSIESFSVSGFDDIQSDKSLSYDKVVK